MGTSNIHDALEGEERAERVIDDLFLIKERLGQLSVALQRNGDALWGEASELHRALAAVIDDMEG